LEWGWAQYVFAHNVGLGDVGVKAGQFKDYQFKEQAIAADTAQPLVERSAADSLVGGYALGGPLVQGVDLVYTGNKSPIHNDLVFMDGTNSGNTDFTNVPTATTKVHWGASDRVDWKVCGDWADTTDLTGQSSAGHDLLDIGGGVGYTDGTVIATGGQTGMDILRFDADAQWLLAKRFTIFTAFYDDYFRNIVGASSRNDMAALVEGGVFVAPAWQVVARYDVTEVGNRFKIATKADFSEIGAGLNYYMGPDGSWGNHAKFSLDVDYLPNGFPSTGATGLGYVASTSDNEIVFRGMFQFWL